MPKVKLSDYIFDYLSSKRIKDVFMVSGGGAMHLVDSVGRNHKLKYYCFHHEQAASMAAEGYKRASGKMPLVLVTSGPGGTNTITGVIGQWLDSVSCVYISGQVKFSTTIASCPELKLRQLGDQEINIIDIVKPITKYAFLIKDPHSIRYHLQKALYLAQEARPGPVWLDIPLDVQSALIDTDKLKSFKPPKKTSGSLLKKQVAKLVEMLMAAKSPVILAGQGIKISGSRGIFNSVINKLRIPVLTSLCAVDLLPEKNAFYAGRPGTIGTRFGNFVLQNADLLISVGTRNNIRQTGYNWGCFAKRSKKIFVDIDSAELKKPTVKADLTICADAGCFLVELKKQISKVLLPDWSSWLSWAKDRRKMYPVVMKDYRCKDKPVNPYCFIQDLTANLGNNDVLVTGNGTASVVCYQAGIVSGKQRFVSNSGCASMGYDLPASIGASISLGKTPVVCLAGDGSLQMNIQELQTLVHYKLPVKVFVLNNNGYISIRQTQDNFFNSRYVGSSKESGVSCPDILKVAKAYGLATERINSHKDMARKIKDILSSKKAFVCEVAVSDKQPFAPKVSSVKNSDGSIVSSSLENMAPFLSKKELEGNIYDARE
ncbi:MAG: thiamine pyrophosphate-binding protein [Candidatus Omnitrophica bacterium]|jgi:acetolactate synthase-1/2/3 large subunit|nr:thiamine pyrophosphate-binding protein [Candidatus Omnitrophota bacterium]